MDNKIDISIVIPLYNEEKSLPELHKKLIKALDQLKEIWEVIYVDDGSCDGSLSILKDFHQQNNKIKILKLSHNYGQQSALMAGFKYSRGNIVITLDADLQNNPEDIPKFLKAISECCDIACGRRIRRKDSFFARKLPSFLINKLVSHYTGVALHDCGCSFRAFTRERIKYILDFGETGKGNVLLGMIGAGKIKEVNIGHSERKHGKSRYNFESLLNLTLDIVTSYSTMPFKLVGMLGLLLFFAGSLMIVYFVTISLSVSIIPDIGTKNILFALVIFLIGLQLLILGFLGEYILRINQNMIKKPMFKIDFFLNGKD